MASALEMDPARAVALLADTTGAAYELVGRLRGGETGAHEVRGPAGERLVVKWDTSPVSQGLRRQAVALAERLRVEARWPVPRQRTVMAGDCLFVLQDFMPGQPVDRLTHGLVDRLLDLQAASLGRAEPTDPSHWPDVLLHTLTVGGQSYCIHDSLRTYDHRTAALIARIEAFGRAIDGADLVGRDIVHWDLHAGNLLQENGTLSAVVDTDFATVGDAAFDLVLLALSSLTVPCEGGVRTRLFGAAFDDLGELATQAYLSHLFIRFLDWPIRRGRRPEVEFWLAQAESMLTV